MTIRSTTCLVALFFIAIATPNASGDESPKSTESQEAAAVEKEIASIEEAFRSLVVEKALSSDDWSGPTAIALSRGYVDSRFNELVDKARQELSREEPDPSVVRRAVKSIGLTDLNDREKVAFLLAVRERSKLPRDILLAIESELRARRSALASLLKERLTDASNVRSNELSALQFLKANTDQTNSLVPLLIEIADSDDPVVSEMAISYADRFLFGYTKELRSKLQSLQVKSEVARLSEGRFTAEMQAKLDSSDEKSIAYAKRILKRNDKNADGVLTSSEWSGMLISPEDADMNKDGVIEVREYAYWMTNRRSR
ncbi:MAG: hypothetical protein AAF802_02435 [Planctomycetota bacterium]